MWKYSIQRSGVNGIDQLFMQVCYVTGIKYISYLALQIVISISVAGTRRLYFVVQQFMIQVS